MVEVSWGFVTTISTKLSYKETLMAGIANQNGRARSAPKILPLKDVFVPRHFTRTSANKHTQN